MDPHEGARRRRLLVVLLSAVVCAGAIVALLLMESPHRHFLGIDVANGLTGAVYASATTIGVTTFRWIRGIRAKEPRITVRELRQRARSER